MARAPGRKPRVDPLFRVRYAAALTTAGETIAGMARRGKIARRTLHAVLAGDSSMSEHVEKLLRSAVGPQGWAYAMGESDLLPCVSDGKEAT